MTIAEWLKTVSEEFADSMIPSARLDAEIILAHTINHPRTWLHAHGDEELDPRRRDIADARAELRLERVPIAYIIGHKYFYGRRFAVSPAVLIPRPESEILIELLKAHLPKSAKTFVDVGTGSGCLGITAKLENLNLKVTLCDISKDALKVATNNARSLSADVRVIESDLLDQFPLKTDVIMANLPYVDPSWLHNSPELANEPELALYADDGGLALIYRLLQQVTLHLKPDGIVILEADPRQHPDIINKAQKNGLDIVESREFGLVFSKKR